MRNALLEALGEHRYVSVRAASRIAMTTPERILGEVIRGRMRSRTGEDGALRVSNDDAFTFALVNARRSEAATA